MIDLVQWRRHWGLTQCRAAQALGVTERHYRRLEAGRSPITRTTTLLLHRLGAGDFITVE